MSDDIYGIYGKFWGKINNISNNTNTQQFINIYPLTKGVNYNTIDTKQLNEYELKNRIDLTKTAIMKYKDYLSNIKDRPEINMDNYVDTYIDTLAAFALLRHSMTIFILLQKEKITQNIQENQKKQEELKDKLSTTQINIKEQQNQVKDAKQLLKNFSDALKTTIVACKTDEKCQNIDFNTIDSINEAHQLINKYILDKEREVEELNSKVKELGELIKIGVPIIATLPESSRF